jgi:hypothetical protein
MGLLGGERHRRWDIGDGLERPSVVSRRDGDEHLLDRAVLEWVLAAKRLVRG